MRLVKSRSAALLDCASALLLFALSGATVEAVCAKLCGAATTLDKSNAAMIGLFIVSSKRWLPQEGPLAASRGKTYLELSDARARAARFPCGRDVRCARPSQKVLGARNLLSRIAMYRKQGPAPLHLAFIAFGFVFRDAHPNQRADQATDCAAHTETR